MSSAAPDVSSLAAAQRRRDIKSGNDPTDLRRRRADTTISLRKQKKEQSLTKRRNTALQATVESSTSATSPGVEGLPAVSSTAAAGSARAISPDDVPELAAGLRSPDLATRVEAARGMRKVLSLETDPPVAEIIRSGSLPLLVHCLDQHDSTDLQV